ALAPRSVPSEDDSRHGRSEELRAQPEHQTGERSWIAKVTRSRGRPSSRYVIPDARVDTFAYLRSSPWLKIEWRQVRCPPRAPPSGSTSTTRRRFSISFPSQTPSASAERASW